ncbi:MAG: hypothetical protein FJY97_20125 [candidate division Zixibacteria bacterium]|nr:hypothetical protein [candidate division Zixibacteria bacterium]
MLDDVKRELETCLEAFRKGELTEGQLNRALEACQQTQTPIQDILYLQAGGTSVTSGVLGMLMVRNGEIWEGPDQAEVWPYKTVLEAIRDGWRVVQFPNLALMLDESRTYGLGAEFILERWRQP